MKNILIIVQKLQGGGAERTASNLSMELSQYYNVILAVFDGSNIEFPYSGELVDLQLPPAKSIFKKAINSIKRIIEIRKIKKNKQIISSISLMFGANIVNVLSRRNDNIIVSARNYMSVYGVNIYTKFREKFIAKMADVEVTPSELVRLDLIESFNIKPNKVVVINNFCRINEIKKMSDDCCEEFEFEPGVKYLVTVGRLNKQKGHWHLIRILPYLKRKIPNIRLIILGEGKLRSDLEVLAKELGVDNILHMPGHLKNPYSVIGKCDLFVFSSIFEGMPNVLVEAIACNKAIVSTDCTAGAREILDPFSSPKNIAQEIEYAEYGVLTPRLNLNNFDSKSEITKEEMYMAEAIYNLLINDGIRKSYESKAEKGKQYFSSKNTVLKWKNIIDKNINPDRKRIIDK